MLLAITKEQNLFFYIIQFASYNIYS